MSNRRLGPPSEGWSAFPPSPQEEKKALRELKQRYSATSPHPRRTRTERALAGSRGTVAPRRRRRWISRGAILLIFLMCIGGGIFGYKILAASNKISVADRSLLGQLKDLLFSSGQSLAGENDSRINILLIAIGGEGHTGQNLADTIMVASVDPASKKIAILSIPRDLYVQVPGEDYFSKINAVHSYGESQKANLGPKLLAEKITEITGVPVHYYMRADFTAFKHVVDAIGGIDIAIEESFFDYWHKISFPAGTEHMNGERALAYVRARYIDGPQGGDFQRAARQQQVLLAIRDKTFSPATAFDFGAVSGIIDSLSDNIRTDMQLWEMKRFFELVRSVASPDIRSTILSTGPKGVLVGETEILGGTPASVLKPRTGDYSEIQAIARDLFTASVATTPPANEPSPSPAASPSPSSTPSTLQASIEIRNGTTITGLAHTTKTKLEAEGYTVEGISNAKARDTEKTTVYALKVDAADTVSAVAEFLNAQTDTGLPADEAASSAEILIILGKDTEQ